MEEEEDCKCLKIIGHLDNLKQCWPKEYRPSPGYLAISDWVDNPFIWLYYVESSDGILPNDDVLISTDTRYWSIHDVQRYFCGDLHCDQVLFSYQYPNLRMPSRLGSYLWKANNAIKLPSKLYMKELLRSFEITLKKMEARDSQMDRLIISDQLIKVDQLDYFKRKTFFRILENLISTQDRLQLVSFENLCCKRLEGVQLIQRLGCFNANSLKYLYLWRFVLPNENPLFINYSYVTGSGRYIPRPSTRQCFLRSLAELRNLRVLALEYAHIADGLGRAIISLLPVLKRPHFRLQIICREDQIPGRTEPMLGVGGLDIPDTAWKRVSFACPDLYLLMTFFRIRDYDNVRRFLTPSMPLRETHLELGIDLVARQRQDSDISCFVRHIAYHYANTLVTFSIHQWRFATFPLRRVFELMPHLVRFLYIGRIEDEVELRRCLEIVASGVCERMKQIKLQIQYEAANRDYWQKVVSTFTDEFSSVMKMYDIDFCICIFNK